MKNSKIQWTDHTFNPWWGCQRVAPECANCYAEAWAKRTGHGGTWGPMRELRTFSEEHWRKPIAWNAAAEKAGKRARVFCASMADVFDSHPVAEQERRKLWPLIASTPWLDWLLLTKRPERLRAWLPWTAESEYRYGNSESEPWSNVWLGTTVGHPDSMWRWETLREVPAALRFVSAEPLLDDLSWDDFVGVDWIILGGESGGGARPMAVEWVNRAIGWLSVCSSPPSIFVKQLGSKPRREGGGLVKLRDKKGGDMAEWPERLRIREIPPSPAAQGRAA